MPIYHTLGNIPKKRHTQFRNPSSNALYHEQLFGTIGFDGMASLLYHIYPPTQIKEILETIDLSPTAIIKNDVKPRLLKGFDLNSNTDVLDSRKTLMFNQHLSIRLSFPTKSNHDYFYKNADADEIIFIHQGSGILKTVFGHISFEYGDYLIIPRGVIYQLEFTTEINKHLIVESHHPVYTPKKYRNWFGQLAEHSPYCERDYKMPTYAKPHDEKGDFLMKIKKQNQLHHVVYGTHPFDVVGWDGYNYPYALSIFDFEPITGRLHQPPPVHQMFESKGFVLCSFVPRLYDYHPLSIPAPYNHSNIDSDEVIYYVDGDFMSRNNIEKGHITLHPGGVPHGPAPGAYERSIGKTSTEELAVMVDTFAPLHLTQAALDIDDLQYYKSWIN
jgi:homogentisate 1,2-dioxygenase